VQQQFKLVTFLYIAKISNIILTRNIVLTLLSQDDVFEFRNYQIVLISNHKVSLLNILLDVYLPLECTDPVNIHLEMWFYHTQLILLKLLIHQLDDL
jgi:hypothetical protein